MQPVNPAQPAQPTKPVSKGQIVIGVLCAMFVLGMILSALGVNTTSKGYCDSTRRDIAAGRANSAAVQRYSSDC